MERRGDVMGEMSCQSPAIELYIAETNVQQLELLADYFSLRPEFAVRGAFTEGGVLLRALQEHPVELVITSLELRGELDALELLQRLPGAGVDPLPRVIVTFDAELPILEARCLQAGAAYYLVKPYRLQRLADRALDVCAFRPDEGQDSLDIWLARLGLLTSDGFYRCFRHCLEAALACSPDFALVKEVYIPAAQAGGVSVSAVETAMRRALRALDSRGSALYRRLEADHQKSHPGRRLTSKAVLEGLAALAKGE